MVRNIVVEEDVQNYVNKIIKNKHPAVGLILGKNSKAKDYVIKLVKCPTKDDNSKGNRIEIDENWIAGHAVELTYMLPGGLNIIGIFFVSNKGDNITYNKLRQAMYTTYKCLSNEHLSEQCDQLLWTVVHLEATNGKTVYCKQYDMNDKTSSMKPADWKYSNTATKWSLVETRIKINLKLNENNLSSKQLEEKINAKMSTYCDSISNALVEVNDVLHLPTEILDPEPVTTGKNRKSKSSTTASKWGKTFTCNFYLNLDDKVSIENFSAVDLQTSDQVIEIQGTVFACAYLSSKSTVEEAIQELKVDLIRNINRRFQLLSEDLGDRNTSIEQIKECSFPKRLCFKETDESFMFFDYSFPNELLSDAILRIKETLDITLDKSNFNNDLENFSNIQPYNNSENNEDIDNNEATEINSKNNYSNSIRAILATGVALAAAALSYFTFSE